VLDDATTGSLPLKTTSTVLATSISKALVAKAHRSPSVPKKKPTSKSSSLLRPEDKLR